MRRRKAARRRSGVACGRARAVETAAILGNRELCARKRESHAEHDEVGHDFGKLNVAAGRAEDRGIAEPRATVDRSTIIGITSGDLRRLCISASVYAGQPLPYISGHLLHATGAGAALLTSASVLVGPVGWYNGVEENVRAGRKSGASPSDVEEMAGSVCEWTASADACDYAQAALVAARESGGHRTFAAARGASVPLAAARRTAFSTIPTTPTSASDFASPSPLQAHRHRVGVGPRVVPCGADETAGRATEARGKRRR